MWKYLTGLFKPKQVVEQKKSINDGLNEKAMSDRRGISAANIKSGTFSKPVHRISTEEAVRKSLRNDSEHSHSTGNYHNNDSSDSLLLGYILGSSMSDSYSNSSSSSSDCSSSSDSYSYGSSSSSDSSSCSSD